MHAIRNSRLGRGLLIAVTFVIAGLVGMSNLSAAEDLSTDEFRTRYDLPKDPKTVLEGILARDEFKNQEESWIVQAQRLMWETFIRALKWIFNRLPGIDLHLDDDIGQTILDVQLIAILALVAGLLVWVFVRLVIARRHRIQIIDPALDHPLSKSLGSSEARAVALKMAEQGDYRGALVHLFRYVLCRLDEQGKLTVGPGKTTREVLAGIPDEEPLRAPLAEMIPIFNRVRYGDADCGRLDYERFRALSRTATERT